MSQKGRAEKDEKKLYRAQKMKTNHESLVQTKLPECYPHQNLHDLYEPGPKHPLDANCFSPAKDRQTKKRIAAAFKFMNK